MQAGKVLFIGGFPGGGTDLLKNIINAHPAIHISGEMPFLFLLKKNGYLPGRLLHNKDEAEDLKTLLQRLDRWKNLENLSFQPSHFPITVRDLLINFFSNTGATIIGNKTPQNSEHINLLLEFFPSCTFIFIIRDVRDIALSWQKKWNKDVLLCADKWNSRMGKMLLDLHRIPSTNYKIIFYEQLLDDLPSHTKLICDFLNTAYFPGMENFHTYVQEIKDGKLNYGKQVLPENYNKWQKGFSHTQIERVEQIAFDMMLHFGYACKYATAHKPLSFFERINGYRKDISSAIFFGNRYSKENSFKERISNLYYDVINYFQRSND